LLIAISFHFASIRHYISFDAIDCAMPTPPCRRHAAADDIDTLSPLSFSFSFDTISMLFDADQMLLLPIFRYFRR
jgi:hypothetical protein